MPSPPSPRHPLSLHDALPIFDALSIERRGGLLFVLINGRSITELQIDRRVSDGRIYIASGLTKADIELMKKDWRLIGQKRSEEHTSELQSPMYLVCRLLLEKK